jgi:hypothetical protein
MPDATIAELMQALAHDAVAYAERHLNITLEFSERSLEYVDRILTDYTKGELLLPDSLSDAQREEHWVFCKMIGGYVGEVIIRNIGGQWQERANSDGTVSVKLVTINGVECSPPASVWRTLTEPFRCIVSYYRGLRVVMGDGDETTVNGLRTVRIPPLSDRAPGE